MEALFNPPRYQLKNHDNFDYRLEVQHEGLKRMVSICENLSEPVPDCEVEEIVPEKPKRKSRKTAA